MNVLLTMFKAPLKKMAIKELQKEELRKNVIEYINVTIDIPKLVEGEEEILISQIYDAAKEAAIMAIERI